MTERYPIGIQHFVKIREANALYVDKTAHIYQLLTGNASVYFLSRPRRFGKSLLISTLAEIFAGNKALFTNLYIYDKIAWEKFPIIRLSFVGTGFEDIGLEKAIIRLLQNSAALENISLHTNTPALCFEEFIRELYKKYQKKVAILIDEYDSPITFGLEKNDFDLAEKNRDILKDFYSILKDNDNFVQFLFITGITKFTKVSIFSELNHLTDITLDERFSTICGYTQNEIEHYFPQGIQKLADKNHLTKTECLSKIKDWYNGFSWDAVHFVYNPFSTLKLFDTSVFSNYWFETGTPSFLIQMLKENDNYQISNLKVSSAIFNTYNYRKLDYRTLLLQTGYLTLKEKKAEDYFLANFPNKEVQVSFNEMLLGDYTETNPSDAHISIFDIYEAFQENNLPQVMAIMTAMFESLPFELYEKKDRFGNTKSVGENFYHAIIYLIFNLLGVKMDAEVSVKEGRIDAVVENITDIYLFEFKKEASSISAITQMQDKNYAGKFLSSGKKIHLVGVSFSLEKRGISEWESEIL